MIGRVCAAQMARQIVRALHIPAVAAAPTVATPKRKPAKTSKKKRAA